MRGLAPFFEKGKQTNGPNAEEVSIKSAAWFVLLAAATWSACAQSTPEQQAIKDAAAALGGSDRIQAVKTLVIEGEGTNGNLGQDVRPDATSQTFNVTGYKRAVDVTAG